MDSAARRPEVVARVGALLRELGCREPGGVTTTELGRGLDLARATVHRLLSSLAAEGLVDRDGQSGRWHLGPEMYLLGSAAAARYDVSPQARRTVRALAAATAESAFFSVRRGDETVCLLREDGSFPLRSHVLHEGIRFPLGVASAGLAILSHLNDRERETYLAGTNLTAEWGPAHSPSRLRTRTAETRATGYATNPGLIVEGSWGLAAAGFDGLGNPAWALSLTGVETRFRARRRRELGQLLLDEAHGLAVRLGHAT